MNDIIERATRYAEKHALWPRGARVAAAVSGGSDSVAMLFVLGELASRGDIVLAGLVHLNHRIRGAEADADEAFCRALAERLGIPAEVATADVPAEAKQHGVSIEVAGRHARRRWFEAARQALKADRVAVAHTRDDQAETVLLRLVRGAGGAGLSAMRPRRDDIVRPLLDCTRDELQQWLGERREVWREDATNADRAIPRNRIRHDVMPALRAINAQADAALARAADILRVDEEFLDRLANAAFVRCVEVGEAGEAGAAGAVRVTIDPAEFGKLPTALARRVARYALETVNPDRTFGLEEVDEAVEEFRASKVVGVTKVRRVPSLTRGSVEQIELRLDIPGTVEVARGAWILAAEGPLDNTGAIHTDRFRVVLDASALGERLIVRNRRPGDRLQPLGAPGRKKVQDVLVDRKVPRDDRDTLPIVTTESGEIVWIAGEVLAHPFRVTPLTKSVVVLSLRR